MSVTAATTLLSAGSSASDFLKRNAKWFALLIIALALWWLFRPYFRVLFGLVPDDAFLQSGGGDVTTEFYNNRKNIARRLHDALTGNALTTEGRCEALYDALQWNDNQLRVIHNTYKNNYGDTLKSDVTSTFTDDCGWFGMNDGQNTALIEKLNLIGLT
ncbi:MAG: hypothetical protein R3D58_13170 [Saprospiraceae bacterium]